MSTSQKRGDAMCFIPFVDSLLTRAIPECFRDESW